MHASNPGISFDINAQNPLRAMIALSLNSPQCGAGLGRTCLRVFQNTFLAPSALKRFSPRLNKTKSSQIWTLPYHSHLPVYPTGIAEHDHSHTSTPTTIIGSGISGALSLQPDRERHQPLRRSNPRSPRSRLRRQRTQRRPYATR